MVTGRTAYPGAEEWVPARPTLARVTAALQECRGCDLYRDTTQAVMGSGDPHAALMIVGEQPGDREDREGEPFVGPAGRILDDALAEAGIDPAGVYTTNAVKHFRHHTSGKRRIHDTPKSSQVRACGPWLRTELELVRPRGVVLLGGTAGKAVHGSGFTVGEARGHPTPWPEGFALPHPPEWTVASIHPPPRPSCGRATTGRRRTPGSWPTCAWPPARSETSVIDRVGAAPGLAGPLLGVLAVGLLLGVEVETVGGIGLVDALLRRDALELDRVVVCCVVAHVAEVPRSAPHRSGSVVTIAARRGHPAGVRRGPAAQRTARRRGRARRAGR